MDVFLMYIAIELGKVLCFPNTCAESIVQEVTTQVEPPKPVEPAKTEEPVEEKTDENAK